MKTTIVGILTVSALLALVGCDDKKSAEPAPAVAKGTTKSETPKNETPKSDAKPDAAKPAPTGDQTTAKGTLELFVKAIQAGDFEKAQSLMDPNSAGWKQLDNVIVAMNTNKQLPDEAKAMVKSAFASGYIGATIENVKEEGDHASGAIKPKKGEALKLELNKLQNKWLVIAPESIMLGAPTVPAAPQSAGNPPAAAPGGAPTPAPAPTTPPPAPAPGTPAPTPH